MDFSTFIFVTTDNEEVKISKEFWDKIAFIKTFHGTGYDDIKSILRIIRNKYFKKFIFLQMHRRLKGTIGNYSQFP
ncbi:hypothetical protein Mgra_00008035 [Meloidogyne graminicola]|uniref:Uncharacterized protein n=1 Tax=Meloidogyne graminicola TaxID=189291 RepID=A0A8S9ZH24_9BILA|nr:hypothetical protein Mgra_00008035 [Meloidogyne graminicola]